MHPKILLPHASLPLSFAVKTKDDNQTTTCWGEGIDRQLQRHDEIWIKTARRATSLHRKLSLPHYLLIGLIGSFLLKLLDSSISIPAKGQLGISIPRHVSMLDRIPHRRQTLHCIPLNPSMSQKAVWPTKSREYL